MCFDVIDLVTVMSSSSFDLSQEIDSSQPSSSTQKVTAIQDLFLDTILYYNMLASWSVRMNPSQNKSNLYSGPGEKLNNVISKLKASSSNANRIWITRFDPSTQELCEEIQSKSKSEPRWNYYKEKGSENRFKHEKKSKSLPGSYRSMLKRRKSKGALFWDSTENVIFEHKNDIKRLISDRRSDFPTELQFKIIGSKSLHQPPPKYTNVCHLCKENIISTQKFTHGKNKPGRKKLNLDKEMTELGLLVSKEGVDICVHQMCVDYVPQMVQNMETEHGILKIDGYKVDEIKKQKGSRCKYCQKNRGMTPCAFRNCKSKKHIIFKIFFNSALFYSISMTFFQPFFIYHVGSGIPPFKSEV